MNNKRFHEGLKASVAGAALMMGLAACAGVSVISTPIVGDQHFPEPDETLAATSGPDHLPVHIPYGLPKALIGVTVSAEGSGKPLKVTIGAPTVLADPAARYMLTAAPSAWANDNFVLKTKGGLLEAVNATNEDQSGQALVKVVEIAGEAAKVVSGLRDARAAGATPGPAFSVSFVLDPFDPATVEDAQSRLAGFGISLELSSVAGGAVPARDPEANACAQSLCYRMLIGIYLSIYDPTGAYGKFDGVYLVQVPDQSQTYGFDIHRGACIKRVTKLSFEQGMLSAAELDKPSEVIGCLNIPLDVLKQIAAVPGEIFH